MGERPTFAELYTFTVRDSTFYFTNYDTDITINNINYKRAIIERSEINYSLDITETNVTINIRVNLNVADLVRAIEVPPSTVQIQGYILETQEIFDIFSGYVKNVSMAEDCLSLQVGAISHKLTKNIPHFFYQPVCNNTLFDAMCGLSESDYLVTVTIDSIEDSTTFIVSGLGNVDDHYYTMGTAIFSGIRRLIVRQVRIVNQAKHEIKIQFSFETDIQVGNVIQLLPGCDKSSETCKKKFNNFSNFNGFPYIPSKNPCIYGVLS